MEKNMPSMVDVLNALSDEKALDIFKLLLFQTAIVISL